MSARAEQQIDGIVLRTGARATLELRGHNGQGSSADGLLVRFTHIPHFTDDDGIAETDTSLTDEQMSSAICTLLEMRGGPLGGLAASHITEGTGYFAQLIDAADRDMYGVSDDEIVGAVVFSPKSEGGAA